jgi:hypothetical protein
MSGPIRAFQWDLARQTERLSWLLAQLPRYADWGYQELYLHLEDAVAYPSFPGIARPDAYSRRDFERLVAAAGRAGLGVVPIVNLLGHTQYLIKVPELRDLNERRAPDGSALPIGQICPLHPRTLEVADRLIADLAPFCTAGKVHVGLDESYALGQHPLSRAEIAEVGLAGHFGRYVRRLHERAAARGLRLGYWADMLALLPGAMAWLPAGSIAYDWYYYPFGRRPALELRNFQTYDLAGPLRARGVDYWGCPMSGPFRHEPLPTFGDRLANLRAWWARCRRVGAAGFLVTAWETARTGAEVVQAVDAAAASLWRGRVPRSDRALLAAGLARAGGARAGRAARSLLAAAEYPYAGYARWENERGWAAALGRGEAPARRREAADLRRRGRAAAAWPPAFRAAWAFRRYLAERDAWVARAADGLAALRARSGRRRAAQLSRLEADLAVLAGAIRGGRRAARTLWDRTRDRRRRGPNEAVLDRDAGELAAWRRWLARVRRDPARVFGPSPVGGAWQFVCRVRVSAPALQQVVLQRRLPGGRWQDVHARFTVEFTGRGARRRGNVVRPFTAALDRPEARLRVAVRGVGPVAICDPYITDGVVVRRARGGKGARRLRLGRPAPTRGFPALDWTRNADQRVLRFDPPRRDEAGE